MARYCFAPASVGALLATIAALSLSSPARASINVPSDGSDGAFNPTADVQVDLSQAVTGAWSDNNAANAGKGVYDPVKWAVVFKYSSVNIPSGVTVTFKNHPSGAPVVWLVQGDVTIAGAVSIDGRNGAGTGELTEAAPGGFAGGAGQGPVRPSGTGCGPGGGSRVCSPYAAGGTYSTSGGVEGPVCPPAPPYGNPQIVPLIGGSGASGRYEFDNGYTDGGSGGGALLIASGNGVALGGVISAAGGVGGTSNARSCGSGGAIRIVADTMSGTGQMNARGGIGVTASGGDGRIRIEANDLSFAGAATPAPSTLQPLGEPVIWPPGTIPSLTLSQIAGKPVPADPHAGLDSADHYATVASVQPINVRLNAKNVPLTWNVVLRVVPFYGHDFTASAKNVSGDDTASVWEATVTVPMGASAFQARASKP
ncbi:MAG TPA: hypothetical protein VGM37_11015 [Armatimonadota bacterium]|jgi:hypothetical protein